MAPILQNMFLFPRALSSTSDIECPAPRDHDPGEPLFGEGSITLHELMVYVSAPCVILTIVSCWFLCFRHLHRYTSPQEQRQILRIVNLPVAYSIFNFLALTFTKDYLYIEPLGPVYEAVTVAALFFLLLEYVAPDGVDREKFFHELQLQDRKGNPQPGGSLQWFQRTWSAVLQYPLLKTLVIIIQIITQYFGEYCESSWSFKHAHLYLTLLEYIFVGGALTATIAFARRMGPFGPTRKAKAKVWSYLGILVFQLIQNLIFHLLNGKLFSPTRTATYNDINFGIASFMTCIEAVIFSFIFHWAFSSDEYREEKRTDRLGLGPAQRMTTFRAILDALNVSDIVSGSILAFQLLFVRVQSRYGGSSGSRLPRQRTLRTEDQVHLEPFSNRDAGYEGASTEYGAGYSPPPEPPMARDPSPGAPFGRAQTFREDGLRPDLGRSDSFQRKGFSRSRSPSGRTAQETRSMIR